MSAVLPFRPRRDVYVVEYGRTHWNIVGIHAGTGRREIVSRPPIIGPALAFVRWADRNGVPVLAGDGAVGWFRQAREAGR